MVASFGERLKLEREKRGITLEEVAGATKISVRNLKALELEKFDQLPGGIFNRGFVRAYAKHLGLDEEQVVADYLEAAGEALPSRGAPGAPADPNAEAGEQSGMFVQVPWGALAGLLVLGTLLWVHYSHRKTPQEGTGEAQSAPEARNAFAPVPGNNSRTGTATAPKSELAASAKAGFEISLQARDNVWLALAVDDKPSTEATLLPGQSMTIHGSNQVTLKIGNVAGLGVFFNGRAVSVKGTPGQVRTLTFTSSGLQATDPVSRQPN